VAHLIDGTALARELTAKTAANVAKLLANGVQPSLPVVIVGEDPANRVYVRRKIAQCRVAGIKSIEHHLPTDGGQAALLSLIDELNADPLLHGILVQLPLPDNIDSTLFLDRIAPTKDVDGFHPVNVGRLSTGTGGLIPCTPLGVMLLLDTVIDEFRGLNVVVIGKSNIVGKPIAMLLLEREATVTVTHIETLKLPDITRATDIIIAAAGAPHLVRSYWLKPRAVVINLGITRVIDPDGSTRLVGDCALDELEHARAATPVPGGVGPKTIACLLSNTVKAAKPALHA
jgi:methylenetetrahydrofolate dehydrogenase (NADP+) / methenyltetrahydrofolate cyclohydrolase